MRIPKEIFVQANSAQVCAFDWPALQHDQKLPALLFAHGASFHARIWDAVIALLPNRCIALDFEGHGRSSRPTMPLHWRTFAEDVIAVAAHSDAGPLFGIGHSLGGHALVQAAAMQPQLFNKLLLIDPVILPAQAYGPPNNEPNPVTRRRADFSSVEEMKEKLGTRPPFAAWDVRVFDDYCRYGVLPKPDGDFTLACAPAIEAAVYDAGTLPDADISALLLAITTPTLVVRSSQAQTHPRDFMASPTRVDLASLLPHGKDVVVEGSHFIPMESPASVATWAASLIQDS